MSRRGQFKIAVLGSASASETSQDAKIASQVGEGVARRSAVLLTGGCPGLPHAAVTAAEASGGLTVAVSPAMNRNEHAQTYGYPPAGGIILFTGMGAKARNVVLVRSADACVFLGGGMGTLNEFTIAFDELGPDAAIGILPGRLGLTGEFGRLAMLAERRPDAMLVERSDPEEMLELIFQYLKKRDT